MPYSIIWEDNGVYIKFSGSVVVPDILETMDRISADPRFDRMRYLIGDYLEVGTPRATREQVDEIVALSLAQGYSNAHYYKVAVAQDPRILALVTHWMATHVHPDRVACAATVDQARQWIACQPPLIFARPVRI